MGRMCVCARTEQCVVQMVNTNYGIPSGRILRSSAGQAQNNGKITPFLVQRESLTTIIDIKTAN